MCFPRSIARVNRASRFLSNHLKKARRETTPRLATEDRYLLAPSSTILLGLGLWLGVLGHVVVGEVARGRWIGIGREREREAGREREREGGRERERERERERKERERERERKTIPSHLERDGLIPYCERRHTSLVGKGFWETYSDEDTLIWDIILKVWVGTTKTDLECGRI